ncbi:MAG TPA: hypothetical protein VJ996_04915 [Solirubrobacteraceae bacterium]|jgi:hypothetical protein|nr:hypothetical protein [Solirubrobacteraceae bacterium]
MADSPNSNPPATAPAEESGVLAALPRTRPQRASARRAAARAARPSGATAATRAPDAPDAAHSAHAAEPIKASTARRTGGRRKAAAKPAATPASRPASRRRAPSVCTPANERAPRQGFEAEPDSLRGPVQPPGGTELIASAAELAGELAKSGVTTGARLVKDLLSRLPG